MGTSSGAIRSQREYDKQLERSEAILRQIRETERILDILRPISPVPRKIDQSTIEKWMALMVRHEKDGTVVEGAEETMLAGEPNTYMAQKCPIQIKTWGSALFGNQEYMNGRTTFIADSVNDLAFAAILGAPCVGCQVVYVPSEEQWYCSDYRIDGAFFPTSEEKLGILVSHLLVQCSQHCHPLSANAVLKLRTPQTIKSVITTAKSMHEADAQFFHGPQGKRRFVDGAYLEPNSAPAHKLFVERGMVRQKDASLTVGAAYAKYRGLCDDLHERPLTRAEFKDIVKEAVAKEFQLRLRHDVIDGATNKMTHGWRGVTLASGNEAFQLN